MFNINSDQDNGQQILSASSNSNTENSQKPSGVGFGETTPQDITGRINEIGLRKRSAETKLSRNPNDNSAIREVERLDKERAELEKIRATVASKQLAESKRDRTVGGVHISVEWH